MWNLVLNKRLTRTSFFLCTHVFFQFLSRLQLAEGGDKYCFSSMAVCEYRGSYTSGITSGHFIWNLWNEPSPSFINFIWNDQKCNMTLLMGFYRLQNVHYYTMKTYCWHGRCIWWYVSVPKSYYTCGHTIFMTRCYPLNNSDIIW